MDPAKLTISIKNKNPLELTDLTASLLALSRQYQKFSSRSEIDFEGPAKLYVQHISSGSVIAELVPFIASTVGPLAASSGELVDLSRNVIQFAGYLKNVMDHLSGKSESRRDAAYTVRDLKEISQILEPVAKDPGAKIQINAADGAHVEVTINYNSTEANAIQNRASKEISALVEPDQKFFSKVSMYWETASRVHHKKPKDRGIIESISEKAFPVYIPDEDVKARMISGKENPFLLVFIVDVELITVQGAIKGYKITTLHDVIESDDTDGDV